MKLFSVWALGCICGGCLILLIASISINALPVRMWLCVAAWAILVSSILSLILLFIIQTQIDNHRRIKKMEEFCNADKNIFKKNNK